MNTSGVPNEEERASQYKGFLDDAALLGQEGARRGDHSVVEQ